MGAVVNAREAPPAAGTVKTCGRLPARPRNVIARPSGVQRSRGAGNDGVKIWRSSASRTGVPPADGTTKSAVSWTFFSTDGVETT